MLPGEPLSLHSHGAIDYVHWMRERTLEPYEVAHWPFVLHAPAETRCAVLRGAVPGPVYVLLRAVFRDQQTALGYGLRYAPTHTLRSLWY
eukprot:3477873-Rhodomonas_salina.6